MKRRNFIVGMFTTVAGLVSAKLARGHEAVVIPAAPIPPTAPTHKGETLIAYPKENIADCERITGIDAGAFVVKQDGTIVYLNEPTWSPCGFADLMPGFVFCMISGREKVFIATSIPVPTSDQVIGTCGPWSIEVEPLNCSPTGRSLAARRDYRHVQIPECHGGVSIEPVYYHGYGPMPKRLSSERDLTFTA